MDDIEIVEMTADKMAAEGEHTHWHDGEDWLQPGWYWLRDGDDPQGPFETEHAAGADAYGESPPVLAVQAEADWLIGGIPDAVEGILGAVDDGEVMVRIVGDEDGELGELEARHRPLGWLNSARITTSPGEDAVHCVVSAADPRGGFCFTVRRHPETGAIIIHTPHPGEGMPHMELRQVAPGTYEAV